MKDWILNFYLLWEYLNYLTLEWGAVKIMESNQNCINRITVCKNKNYYFIWILNNQSKIIQMRCIEYKLRCG